MEDGFRIDNFPDGVPPWPNGSGPENPDLQGMNVHFIGDVTVLPDGSLDLDGKIVYIGHDGGFDYGSAYQDGNIPDQLLNKLTIIGAQKN
jgi:hypothetical protein